MRVIWNRLARHDADTQARILAWAASRLRGRLGDINVLAVVSRPAGE
jgi:hypothetical protein